MSTASPPQNDALEAARDALARLRGRMFEALESFGLSDRQLEASKKVIRRVTFDLQEDLEALLRKD